MNKWSELGEKQMVGPRKSIMRGVKTRAERKLEKEKQDRDILFKQWKEWHEKRKRVLLEGPLGGAAEELSRFLEGMTIRDAPALIELVKSRPWHLADSDVRFLVLGMISHSIIYLREREGLPPFDDPMPFDDDPDVFMIIKGWLSDETHQALP